VGPGSPKQRGAASHGMPTAVYIISRQETDVHYPVPDTDHIVAQCHNVRVPAALCVVVFGRGKLATRRHLEEGFNKHLLPRSPRIGGQVGEAPA